MKTRKSVSLDLSKLDKTDFATINEWLNNQKSNQDSILNVLLHVIYHMGTDTDIQSYDAQKKLFTAFSNVSDGNVSLTNVENDSEINNMHKNVSQKDVKKEQENTKEETDDFLSNLKKDDF